MTNSGLLEMLELSDPLELNTSQVLYCKMVLQACLWTNTNTFYHCTKNLDIFLKITKTFKKKELFTYQI